MTGRLVRVVVLLVAAASAILATARLLDRPPGGGWPPVGGLGPAERSPSGRAPAGCVRDPTNLPPPPPGPDGRPANYLHTCGSRIYDSRGHEVKIAGISWSGMEHGDRAPSGLATRNWQDLLDQIAALGYNTVRVPFSNDTLNTDRPIGNVDYSVNPDLQGLNGLEMLDRLVAGARDRGLKVVLDRHYVSSGNVTTLWYTREVPEERWIADWRMLAARYAGDDTVVGVDLHNEPHGETTWGSGDPATDWRLAAERAGNAVHEANPYLLVFVEGIENYDGDHSWWGGDLQGARTAPVRLRVPNRVVYSPHDYGPSVSGQAWFWDPSFPANLPAEWDRRWGYIQREGIAPVVVGEFGGRSFGEDRDGQWQRALLAYLRERDVGAMVWSLNPNWDTGGIYANDWRTVDWEKQEAYRQLLAAPIDGALGAFGQAPARYRVLYQQQNTDPRTGTVAFSFQIANDGQRALDLSHFELRYWLATGALPAEGQRIQVEAGDMPGEHVHVDLVPADRGGQDHYLRVRFDPEAGTLGRYQGSGKVTVRLSLGGEPDHLQAADHSYAASPRLRQSFGEWDRVTLYLDGQLVSGREP